MFEAVGIIGTGVGGAARATHASAPTPAASTGSSEGTLRAPLSPRMSMRADPEAGIVIAEYLSASGEKSMQIPSETVVAYLRSGLSADGSSRAKADGVTA